MLSCEVGEGRAVVLASDLDNRWNDFPLACDLRAVRARDLAVSVERAIAAGEFLVADVPPGVPPTPGFATLAERRGTSVESRRVAVNVDPRESDLTRMSADEFQGAVTRLKEVAVSEARVEAGQQEDRQHLWMYVLGLTLAVLAVESLVASRTA